MAILEWESAAAVGPLSAEMAECCGYCCCSVNVCYSSSFVCRCSVCFVELLENGRERRLLEPVVLSSVSVSVSKLVLENGQGR